MYVMTLVFMQFHITVRDKEPTALVMILVIFNRKKQSSSKKNRIH